jgi:hypothetical protein
MTHRTRRILALAAVFFFALIAFVVYLASGLRQHLREDNVIWDLKQTAFGLAGYARDHDDSYPASLDDLLPYMFPPEMLATDLHDHPLFRSPYGPAPDGGPDYLLRTDLAGRKWDTIPDSAILAIDRAALLRGRSRVFVLLADGSSIDLTRDELQGALARNENRALANRLGWP